MADNLSYLIPEQIGVLLAPIRLRVRVTEAGCWEWQGGRTSAGYGHAYLDGRMQYVHRVMVERMSGSPIPPGREVDHLCRNPPCCNPNHLEVVTHAENMRRGRFGAATHCPRGHAYEGANLRINASNGGRECRACIRERKRRAYRAANPVDRSPASRTHCPREHPLSGDNLYVHKDGRRECRACRRKANRESARRAYAAKKARSA